MIHTSLKSRRHWLMGVGGTLVGLPLLPSLLPSEARATVGKPRRFVFIGSRWGRDIDRGQIVIDGVSRSPWYPHGEPAQIKSGVGVTPLSSIRGFDGYVSPVFSEAWDDIRDKYAIVRGLDGMQIAGDGHGSGMAMTASGSLSGGRVGFGYSMDVVLQESTKIYPETPYVPALRTSVGGGVSYSFSFTSRTGVPTQVPSDLSPFDVYNRLFHPDALTSRQSFAERQRPVLNDLQEEYRALTKPGLLSSDDRAKLESHLDLVSRIEKSLGVSLPSCSMAEPTEATTAESLHDVTMDLEIAALACGATNVVSHIILHHNSELTPNTPEAHSAAHGGISRPEESGRTAVPQWKNDKWVMARVASFIKKLAATPDGDGSLLDSTVLLYGNWEARGYHSFYDMPVIVAGSPDVLGMGNYYDYRPRPLYLYNGAQGIYGGRPYNGLLVTLLQAMGLGPEDYERFGQKGFGVYDGYDVKLTEHYRPFLNDRNATLPLLIKAT